MITLQRTDIFGNFINKLHDRTIINKCQKLPHRLQETIQKRNYYFFHFQAIAAWSLNAFAHLFFLLPAVALLDPNQHTEALHC